MNRVSRNARAVTENTRTREIRAAKPRDTALAEEKRKKIKEKGQKSTKGGSPPSPVGFGRAGASGEKKEKRGGVRGKPDEGNIESGALGIGAVPIPPDAQLDIRCPYCGSAEIVKRGTRTNAYQTVQLYICRAEACGRTFTGRDLKGTKFPLAVVADGLTFYNLGYTMSETCAFLRAKFGVRPSEETLSAWYASHKELCRFERMRSYALKMFEKPADMVEIVTMAHRQLYRFRYHIGKMRLILEEFRNHSLRPVMEYLDNVSSETPHQYFSEGERISDIRSRFEAAGVIVRQKVNYANRLAAFVLAGVRKPGRRHDELQRFFLANDSVTVATETPVYIRREDIEHLENVLHFDVVGKEGIRFRNHAGAAKVKKAGDLKGIPRLLTGHIDFVQVRNGSVHLLDYKPNAAKERPIEQLTWYALAMSRLTGLRLYNFTCAWFDEKDYFEFYPLHVVKRLAKPAKLVRFRSGAEVKRVKDAPPEVADVRGHTPKSSIALSRPGEAGHAGSRNQRGRKRTAISGLGRPVKPGKTKHI